MGPADLAAPILRAALDRAQLGGEALDLVILGNVLRAGHGQLVPRQAALKAGVPPHVDAMAVDMVCASGMMSVMTAASFIRAGVADIILAGGTEAMSNTGFYLSSKARWGYKYVPGPQEPVMDLLFRDGLSDPLTDKAMGLQAERLSQEWGVARAQLDAIAHASHHRADQATRDGCFSCEIIPLTVRGRTLAQDEGIRPETTIARLSQLRPAFAPEGVLTAGNSSQISDGAAAVILASQDAVTARGLVPMARILSSGWAAGEPWRFPEAPAAAVQRVLQTTGLSVRDIDLFENNEAFALSSILFHRMLEVPYDKINAHGGAIALGHPIGCSGARILVTLLHALERKGAGVGLAAVCHGTGGATALAVERK